MDVGPGVKLPPEHLQQICSMDINHKFIDAFLIKGMEWEYFLMYKGHSLVFLISFY